MKRLFYRKSQRIKSQSEFRAILSRRISSGQGMFRLFVCPVSDGHSRFGVSISKAAGIPIVRNRLKRLARQAFRLNQHNLPANLDYVLIISPKMTKKTTSENLKAETELCYEQFEVIFMGLVGRILKKVPQNH